jgi:hypothetical protein
VRLIGGSRLRHAAATYKGTSGGGGGGGITEPDGVSGLFVWHRASDLALSADDPISTWTDESGNGRHLTATTTARPTFKTGIVNGQAIARFNGTSNRMAYADNTFNSLTGAEVFVVLKLNVDPPAAEAQTGLWTLDGSSTSTHYPYTDGVIYDGTFRGSRVTTSNPVTSLASWHAYNVFHSGASWGTLLNGVALHGPIAAGLTFSIRTTGLLVGASLGAVNFAGDMAELFIYDHVVTGGERATIHAYLNTRYGFSLP